MPSSAETYLEKISKRMLSFLPRDEHHSVTDLSSVVSLDNPNGSNKLMIQVLTQNLRFTLDGSDPSATHGFQLQKNQNPIVIPVSDAVIVKVIEETASASMEYQWGI